MPAPRPTSSRQLALFLLLIWLLVVAALTLLPIGWAMNRFVVWLYFSGLQLWRFPLLKDISLDALAGLLNVVLMIPLAMAAVLSFPKRRWWQVTLIIVIVSACIELAQASLPLGREGSAWDVLTNGIGGILGALLGRALLKLQRPRRSQVQPGHPPRTG